MRVWNKHEVGEAVGGNTCCTISDRKGPDFDTAQVCKDLLECDRVGNRVATILFQSVKSCSMV